MVLILSFSLSLPPPSYYSDIGYCPDGSVAAQPGTVGGGGSVGSATSGSAAASVASV